jgi:hypothetical protein
MIFRITLKYYNLCLKLVIPVILQFITFSLLYAQSVDKNYVKTTKIKIPTTNSSNIQNLKDNEVQSAVQYIDGLGRPVQTINIKTSPSKTDVVMVQEYDMHEREAKKYLPYA